MSQRIVVVGGGAGGLELATLLGRTLGKSARAEVLLVDGNLTHIWKPLLHEVAAGVLDVATEELSYTAQARWNHFRFVPGRMIGLDRRQRQLRLAAWTGAYSGVQTPPVELSYDVLVLAVGSIGNDFGTPGVAEHCLFLDSVAQAEALRQNMLERHISRVAQGIAASLRVVVVGGGATGVELCAELLDANRTLAHYQQGRKEGLENLDITLLEAGPRLLAALPERISHAVRKDLRQLGITVKTATAVARAEANGLYDSEGTLVPADVMVWAAGVRAPAFLRDLDGLESGRNDQLVVLPTLQTTRDPDVFALGDCAACPLGGGSAGNVPALAQAAHQQALLLADNLRRRLDGQPLRDYHFQDRGTLVSLASYNTFGKLFGNHIVEG
ncbi:MAG: NAD(P)/FAD-dependent oxidoreductase, partial [Rhodanobacter sp.]